MLFPGLFVITDADVGSENDVAELSGRQELRDYFLIVDELQVEAGRDHTALIESSEKLNHNLAGPAIVDDFELSNIAVLLHHLEELHDSLGNRSNKHLSLALLLRIDHSLEAVCQTSHTHHLLSISALTYLALTRSLL